jgi:predicted MFS family arabinose efflux permease
MPNSIMVAGLLAATAFGTLLPFVDDPIPVLFLHGFSFSFAAPVVASLVAESLRPETRGPGLGLYYLWYYAGCATLPAVAGSLKDRFGTNTAVLFAAALLAATLLMIGLFRIEQRRHAVTVAQP